MIEAGSPARWLEQTGRFIREKAIAPGGLLFERAKPATSDRDPRHERASGFALRE